MPPWSLPVTALAGSLALTACGGGGGYEAENGMEGEITTTMTGLYPYGRYALTPRGIWATAGYGWGNLSLTSEGTKYNPATKMTMAAAGMDGLLLDGGAEGLSLSTIADVLTVKTAAAVDGLPARRGTSPVSGWDWRRSGRSPCPMALPYSPA